VKERKQSQKEKQERIKDERKKERKKEERKRKRNKFTASLAVGLPVSRTACIVLVPLISSSK